MTLDFQALTAYLNRPDPSLQCLAIMADGRMAGGMAVRSPWLRGPYLELLAIFPQAQRRGLGQRSLDWAFARAREQGAANFWACVSAFNRSARDFYAQRGFVEAVELADLVQLGETEILLRKRLDHHDL